MAEIEPKTREEKLWNGEDIEPVTREEMYIKHIFDNTQTIPDHPITRKEMLMEKAGEGGGGDITIKQLIATENKTYSEEDTAYSPVIVNVPDVPPVLDELTVTENGTYTPPSGTDGYDEVTVSVPLPPNAYLLKEIEDVAIASFNDGADLPMPKLKVAIEPVQEGSGEPSPTNVRPISGWDEANVSVSPLNITPLYNGQVYNDGAWLSSTMRLTNVSREQDNSCFLKAGTYTLDYDKLNSNAPSLLQCTALTKDDNYTIIDNFSSAWNDLPLTFTLTQDGYLYFTIRKDADTTLNVDDYKAKILGHTYTIDLDGTRYGCTLDVVSGVLTVDRGYVDLGDLTWTYRSTPNVFSTNISGLKRGILMCSNYKYTDVTHVEQIEDSEIWDKNYAFGATNVVVKDLRYTSASDFKTAMNGVQLVYELATPITIQLTPTMVKSLVGQNNVWADTGDILEASYFAKEVSA